VRGPGGFQGGAGELVRAAEVLEEVAEGGEDVTSGRESCTC
jgi:hypothetical protein